LCRLTPESKTGSVKHSRAMLVWNRNNASAGEGTIMATRKNDKVPIFPVKKGESLKSIYARLRREFTAADLAKYAEIEEGIPLEQIIAELEGTQAQPSKKPKPKTRKKA
jgi:hypothetical protein